MIDNSFEVLCSAGKGVLQARECLACALSAGTPPCEIDYVTLRALYADNERRPGIHVTALLGCLLEAFWRATDPAPEAPHRMLVRSVGSAWHAYVEGNDEHVETELAVEGLGLVGTADIVYKNGRLVDTKTTRWMKLKYLPYNSHVTQVNIYRRMLESQGRDIKEMYIQYIDVSGPTKCKKCQMYYEMIDGAVQCPSCGYHNENSHLGAKLIEVPFIPDGELDGYVKERRETLENAIAMGISPEAEPSYICNFCAFADRCPAASRGEE